MTKSSAGRLIMEYNGVDYAIELFENAYFESKKAPDKDNPFAFASYKAVLETILLPNKNKMKETLEQYIERLKERRTEDDYGYTDEDLIDYMEHIEDSHKNNLSVYKCLEFMYFAERKTSEQVKDLSYWKNNAEEDYIATPISVLRYISELEKSRTFSEEEQIVIEKSINAYWEYYKNSTHPDNINDWNISQKILNK